jgi:hypothetical protein
MGIAESRNNAQQQQPSQSSRPGTTLPTARPFGFFNSAENQAINSIVISTGIYPSIAWDSFEVKKMIYKKQIAPVSKGSDDKIDEDHEECLICYLVRKDKKKKKKSFELKPSLVV